MPTAADYRRQAETCLSLAMSTPDAVLVQKLRAMACDLMAKSLHPDDPRQAGEDLVSEFPALVTRRPEQSLPPFDTQPHRLRAAS
jgi:hypothetical protein